MALGDEFGYDVLTSSSVGAEEEEMHGFWWRGVGVQWLMEFVKR